MFYTIEDEDLIAFANHRYKGVYKRYKSNKDLIESFDIVLKLIEQVHSVNDLRLYRKLNYERLVNSPCCSIRLGYKSKFRLIVRERQDGLELLLIEISEHYGDH